MAMNSMRKRIRPGCLRGTFRAPASKSVTHRLLLMAALCGKPAELRFPLLSEDTRLTVAALQAAGFELNVTADRVVFSGNRKAPEGPVRIETGNSGTTARFVTALAAVLPGEYIIDGAPRMRERPMGPLIEALLQLKVPVRHTGGHLPLRVEGGKLSGTDVTVDASQSSQFLSALLLAAPLAGRGLRISAAGDIASRSYVDLTLSLMRQNGIRIVSESHSFLVAGGQHYRPVKESVEGDYSSAACFLTGAALSGGRVTAENLKGNSLQGDRLVLEILKQAGADVTRREGRVTVSGEIRYGFETDMNHAPDLVPAAAVLALFAPGKSVIRRIEHLRFKESDRLNAVVENIRRLGGRAVVEMGDLIIQPGPLHGGALPVYDDHRIAMSFALAGLRVPGIVIENPGCVAKSYPEFWSEFEKLYREQ